MLLLPLVLLGQQQSDGELGNIGLKSLLGGDDEDVEEHEDEVDELELHDEGL